MADLPPAAVATLPRRRLGVDAEHENYKWWALSCTEPGHAAGDDQLGHADHRPARPRARAGHQHPRARLGDPRLHDRLDRARAHGRAAVGPLRAQARLRRRLRRLRARLAGRRLRRQRHRADPVAHRPGHRRRASCSPTPPRWSPTPSRASSSALAMGTNTMVAAVGLVSGRCSAARWSRSRWHWVFWFNVPLGARRRAVGLARPARARRKPDAQRGSTCSGTATFVVGLTGLVLGISKGGISGWDDPRRHRRPRRRRRPAAAVRRSSSATAARRCST